MKECSDIFIKLENVKIKFKNPKGYCAFGYIYIKNGTLNITAADDAIRGNSIVQIDGGTINIKSCEEGIEANNIKINDGEITLYAKNDGINATPKVNNNVAIEVNGGSINVTMGSGDTDAFDSNGNIYINDGELLNGKK